MFLRFKAVLLVAVFFTLGLQAQKRYLFHTYTTKDGLSNNTVNCINQDQQGYLWFGTNSGLSRFDGYSFQNNSIPQIYSKGSFVQYIEKDSQEHLSIVGILQGVHIQQSNHQFQQFLIEPEAIGKNTLRTIKVCKDHSYLFGGGRYLYKFKNSKFKLIYDSGANGSAVNTIEIDKSDNVWFGGSLGVAIMDGKQPESKPWFLPEFKNLLVIKLLFVKSNVLMVGTSSGLYQITLAPDISDPKKYTITRPVKELSDCFINHLYLDKSSNLWVSTSIRGVYKLSGASIVDHIKKDNGLPSDDVMCTFQDKEGNYWFASGTGGVSKLTDFNRFTSPEIEKQLSDAQSILKDPFGRQWIWGGNNLFIGDHGKITPIDLMKTPLFEGGIKELLFSKDNKVWFANYDGLYAMPLSKKKVDISQLKQIASLNKYHIAYIRMFAEDNQGNIWIGSDNGLYVFHQQKLSKCIIQHRDSSKIRPFRLINDSYGKYWMSDFNYGLYHMDLHKNPKGNLCLDHVKAYKSLKPDSAFVTAWIQDLKLDSKGYLWEASLYTGIYKITIDSGGVKDAYLYSSKNGLPNNCVSKIVEDKNGNFWFASLSGAIYLNSKMAGTKPFSVFNSKNGLGDEVEDIYPEDSLVYIRYAEGFYAINPLKEKKDLRSPPPVIISVVSVMGKSDTSLLSIRKVHQFNHRQNYIGFDFLSVSFLHENGITYQYKLKGLDDQWSNYSDRRYVSYNSLAPGHYVFQVRAKSLEGIESKDMTNFEFVISPPFYKTWEFILSCFLLLLTTGYFAYNYRVNQLLKMERMRTRIASDLHDDIGSTLSSISILSEILSKHLDHPHSSDMIDKIGVNARSMLESMDDIIWAVNPSNDKFQNLGLRIREYAIPLFESKGIDFQINFPETMADLTLSMDIRRNVFLIAKEAINNMIKYSQSKTAYVGFYVQNSHLYLDIKDEGKGFEFAASSHRNGLVNMKRRANQINGQLSISSIPEKGTSVYLEVQLI